MSASDSTRANRHSVLRTGLCSWPMCGRRALAVAVVTLGLLVTSCSSDQNIEQEDMHDLVFGDHIGHRETVIDFMTRCMAEQGFEYVSHDQFSYTSSDYIEDDAERVATIGSGLTHSHIVYLEEHGAYGEMEPVGQEAEPEYQEAMYEAAIVDGDTHEGGCADWTYSQISSIPVVKLQEALADEYHGWVGNARSDLRISELNDEWARCIAEQGFHDFHAHSDVQEAISERANEAAFIENEQERSRALEEALEYDIELTSASYECVEEVDYETRFAAVIAEYEAAFTQEQETRLKELRDLIAE